MKLAEQHPYNELRINDGNENEVYIGLPHSESGTLRKRMRDSSAQASETGFGGSLLGLGANKAGKL